MNTTTGTVRWQAEPDGRGTIGLLWSCFATIFICTWSATHLSIPAQDNSQIRIIFRHMKYMILAVLAPELVATVALIEYWRVKESKEIYQFENPRTMKPWSSKQYFFLEMGGFVVQTSSTSDALCFDVNTIAHLITQNIVDPPTITDKDIDDRSKSNWLTKSLALIQVTYFLVQLLGRAIYKLPTTTLELFTLGIIVCAVITYVAWWKKPFDVQTPVILQARAQDYAWPPTTTKDFNYLVSGKPNKKDCQRNTSVCVVISLCFTATHFIGWNFHFATEVETWAWRCSSVVCAVLPIYYITVKLTASLDGLDKAWLTVYILARVVLLVEVCIGLRSVPPGVYQTVPWSQYFPSLS